MGTMATWVYIPGVQVPLACKVDVVGWTVLVAMDVWEVRGLSWWVDLSNRGGGVGGWVDVTSALEDF